MLTNSSPPASVRTAIAPLLFGTVIFLSAFLLFGLEPFIAKRILPWFGGSAAVWSICLVFFQTALLVGYLYARLLTRSVPSRLQTVIHIAVLAASLCILPIGPGERWKPGPLQDPSWLILALLTATIGLPFVALSATSPLLQDWVARAGHESPYRFFAVSNFASLAALLAYPLLVEPALDLSAQRVWWSVLYLLFALLCTALALRSRANGQIISSPSTALPQTTPRRRATWIALAACGSMLLLSVTNHINENLAAVPLLWVLPLAVYLATFILAFARQSFYKRTFWFRALAFSLGILGYSIYTINSVVALQISIPVFLLGLFVACYFCHAELNRLKPHSERLTGFYLMVALGGALGAIFVGIIAPHVFRGIYELPLALILTALLALLVTWHDGGWPVRLLWTAVAGCMVAVCVANVRDYRENALSLRRSFYGSLRVVQSPHAGPQQTRTLFHGTIEHGAQLIQLPGRRRPITYYGPDSGIGIVLRECFPGPKRVGVVGLGIGTITAYGHPGDVFRFYEINRQVIEMAQSLFFYLRETPAQTDIIEGDGRLSLERDTSPPFDVIALDAFSGDAIPVHLLTEQALALYRKHLKPQGVVAFHVSNDYLDLAPVVAQLAQRAGLRAVLVHNHENRDEFTLPADWVLVTGNASVLDNPTVKVHAESIPPRSGLRPWTDDYNNLLQILKVPALH